MTLTSMVTRLLGEDARGAEHAAVAELVLADGREVVLVAGQQAGRAGRDEAYKKYEGAP